MTTDIIERLDIRRRQETEITELELLLLDAADEIEKLRAKLAQPRCHWTTISEVCWVGGDIHGGQK